MVLGLLWNPPNNFKKKLCILLFPVERRRNGGSEHQSPESHRICTWPHMPSCLPCRKACVQVHAPPPPGFCYLGWILELSSLGFLTYKFEAGNRTSISGLLLFVLVAKSCLTLATPWTVASQAPLSVGFSRQEYGSGLPFPSPVDY